MKYRVAFVASFVTVLLALLASCVDAQGIDSLSSPRCVTAWVAGKSATACDTLWVRPVPTPAPVPPPPAPLPGPSAAFPNLPSGMATVLDYSMRGLLSGWSATNATTGHGNAYLYVPGSMYPVADATAPGGPATVLEILYPKGLGSGTAPAGFWAWSTANYGSSSAPMREIYEATTFKLVGTDWENPGGGPWKLLGYWAVGSGTADNDLYNTLEGGTVTGSTAAGAIHTSYTLQMRMQNTAAWAQYGSAFTIAVGRWYRFELYAKTSSAAGKADGIVRVWLTDLTAGGSPVKTIDAAVTFQNSGAIVPFWKRSFVPIWGGAAPAPKTRNDYLRLARMYIAGRP